MIRGVRLALLGLALLACDDDGSTAGPPDGAVDAAIDTAVDTPPDAAADGPPDPLDAEPDRGPPLEPVVLATAGMASLRVDDRAIELRHGDALRLSLPAAGLQLGAVPEVSDRTNYDPYYVYAETPGAAPAGLTWAGATRLVPTLDGDTLRVELDYGPLGTGALAFTAADDRLAARWTPPPMAPVAYFRLRAEVDDAEGFYGLGEVFDTPNHRGRLRAMQLVLDTAIESANNEAHVPVPLLIGTTGWGLFLESLRPAAFSVAVERPDLIDAAVGAGPASPEGLSFHLFTAEHPLDITRDYFEVTGFPRLPARWALGPWVWRDENRDQAQVMADLDAMRDLDLATTGIWVDRPYSSGVQSFDFHPDQFPDAQGMIDRAHALGFRFALWHTGYVGEDQAATAGLHAEAEANGYYPPEVGPIVNSWGRPVDFTNPAAFAWYQDLVRRYTAMGVEGFKLDYMEDIVVGLFRARNVWRFADGSDERTMHKGFQTLYHRAFAELLPEDGGFLLTRTGTWGGQVNGNVIWPGDLDADMSLHREERIDRGGEAYVAVGGLPASMVAGLSLGPSGYAFYGSDTGGYRHCPPDKETFVRWFQQTALSSVMQVGTSCNDVAWEPTERNGFDAEVLALYRDFTRLHLRLWPYAWTLATELATTGRPLQRPFGLQHPELGDHRWDAYFFGDALLVAPVVERGARQKAVPFPPGTWFDWFTGEVMEGGAERTVDAPLHTLPLYLKAGGIVPMLRPTIDTLAPTTEPDRVDSYATDAGRLYARVALGADGDFTLFDGARIALTGETVQLTAGAEFDGGWQLELVGRDVVAIEVDGEVLPAVESLDALDAAETGWVTAGAFTHVKVGAEAGAVTLR